VAAVIDARSADSAAGSAEQVFAAVSLLGGELPEAVDRHLRAAGRHYADDARALEHLAAAAELAPAHPAVLIGRYRFFFYKGRWADALAVAGECLAWAARLLGLPADWRDTRPQQAEFGAYHAVPARFYLFTLKGYAYLSLRLDRLAEGQAAARKLLELDPADRVGGQVLLDVLRRREAGDDDA
jgi:tetratricopeptide (TPR) repeat protein